MINQTDIAHSTPPQLWRKTKVNQLFWRGLVRDQVRIRRLARQVEKLSFMLEYIEDQTIEGIRSGYGGMVYINNAEAAWNARDI